MMFAIKMLLALFLSGAIFLFTLYRLLGFRFRLTYKKLLLSIVLSFCISTPVHAVHHSYMGLSEHLWFDNLGIVVFAVLLACAAAGPVSYTHLDVYKRQLYDRALGAAYILGLWEAVTRRDS